MNNRLKKAVILLIWLVLWQVTAFFVNNPIYFVSPFEVITELFSKLRNAVFWQSVAGSLLRIIIGFSVSFTAAFIMSFASYRFKWIREFLSPLVTFLKSVPVAAVVVILLIWWGSRYLVLSISMMVVFPNIYLNMLTGLDNTDKGLLEMADVFNVSIPNRILWIFRTSYRPHLHSAVSVSLGMCLKSGIAAEIIGLPRFSAGEQLYRDKIYLNTAGVFAWVIVILALSTLTERLISYGLTLLSKVPSSCPDGLGMKRVYNSAAYVGEETDDTIIADNIIKYFDDRKILDTDFRLKKGHVYFLKAPSGSGKTTLLKILSGITPPDSGRISRRSVSMVFQDDRLIEQANGLRNLYIAGCRGDLKEEYLKLLPEQTLMLPVQRLSGGERRRLCILRAVLCPSEAVIMDEPFAGLDDETKKVSAEWILNNLKGRTLLYTSHDSDTDFSVKAQEISLKKFR